MTGKRKRGTTEPEVEDAHRSTPKAKQSRKSVATEDELDTPGHTPSKTPRTRHSTKINKSTASNGATESPRTGKDIPIPKKSDRILFSTPSKPITSGTNNETPSPVRNADRSARRKSAKALIERTITGDLSDDNEPEEDILARQIWDEDDVNEENGPSEEDGELDTDIAQTSTPSKPSTKRAKAAQRKRSPTPLENLPPHEQYFFQNRPGRQKTSSNTLASLSLLSHTEYHDLITTYNNQDPCASSISYLHTLHSRSFPQWTFELSQNFSICLYGYGSKRHLVTSFATHLHSLQPPPTTILIYGYNPHLTPRQILTTLTSTIYHPSSPPKSLPSNPPDLLPHLLAHLTSHPPPNPITLLINSLDAPPLRRPATQSLLAQLSTHPSIHLLATCDNPSFPLLWDSTLTEQFNWVFHDTTTFVSYDGEGQGTGEAGSVVDAVNELMGRRGAASKGRDGVRWVLKSLPENARNLYRVLVAEILAGEAGGEEEDDDDDDEDDDLGGKAPQSHKKGRQKGQRKSGDKLLPGVDYKMLYQKAVEEFICSSEMNFRTLLKEFHDHQMVVARKDEAGTEVLGVPLRREEMEGLLEDLMG